MQIGIVVGSIREGRVGAQVADWLLNIAKARSGEAEYTLIDLKSFDLPLFDGPVPPSQLRGNYDHPAASAWASAIAGVDGLVFVSPEYNRAVPGAMKNAVDSIFEEWKGKPIAFAGYGYHGGKSALAQWHQIFAGFKILGTDEDISLNLGDELVDGVLQPADGQVAHAHSVLDQLEARIAEAAAN